MKVYVVTEFNLLENQIIQLIFAKMEDAINYAIDHNLVINHSIKEYEIIETYE